ncbi:beta-D-xylosidase 7-like, partial [Trifolium medium]|nr:beta-D-xylosidase 7-like [Trifolium medium]
LTCYHQLVHAESPTQPPYSCDITNPLTKSYPFFNLKLPIAERAKDIVSRLTMDEKLTQLINTAPSIPRLGIPSYQWWSEALHGVADFGFGIRLGGNLSIKGATIFPQVILTTASFDPKLWYKINKTCLDSWPNFTYLVAEL